MLDSGIQMMFRHNKLIDPGIMMMEGQNEGKGRLGVRFQVYSHVLTVGLF